MFVLTHPGRLRSHNEDSVFINPARGIAILADGLGGYRAGEVASRMAVMMLADSLGQAEGGGEDQAIVSLLRGHVLATNQAIHQLALGNPGYTGMGTTLVFGSFLPGRVLLGHIGDSRCYQFRKEVLTLLTHDHSLVQEQIDQGVLTETEARYCEYRGMLTRALGTDAVVEVETHFHKTEPGDIYLFCSDGLSDMVKERTIARTLLANAQDLSCAGKELVRLANEHGGYDNISVILVRVGEQLFCCW